ncbi:HMGCL [Symbiodinium microadriaticum]|nr:HMGCL [Symbiodinium microadriaticum]
MELSLYNLFGVGAFFRSRSFLPKNVKVVEVGPRDGLQNEKQIISLEAKVELIHKLASTGLSHIEVGSFVSPKWVPQMADTPQLFEALERRQILTYSVLTPNMKGLQSAVEVNVKEVAVFAAASELFSQRNINCSISQSLSNYRAVCDEAISKGIKVRGYVSCVYGCPYEGEVDADAVLNITKDLLAMGCYEVSLGDTIGVGDPTQVDSLLSRLHDADVPLDRIAVHFHDTGDKAVANILVALQHGIRVIDSSVAGLGGCPYAEGASGNVATEDVVYILGVLGIESGVDLSKLMDASRYINSVLTRHTASKLVKSRSRVLADL